MPLNPEKAREQWARYVYSRDTGHREYIAKANRCEDFFAGFQWDPEVVNELRAQRRPALTINKVLITLSSIFGEQIETRAEIGFKPRYGAPTNNAETLTKLFKCISDDNQLDWVRSEVFADGAVTSRGYYDVRLKFDKNQAGEVSIMRLNPRSVLPDPDGSDYDPETWNDVITTSWVTADDIAIMYNEDDAEALRLRSESIWAHGYDSVDTGNDRFGGSVFAHMNMAEDIRATMRGIRVIDRQHRVMTKMQYLVDPKSGDRMRVPDKWSRDEIAFAAEKGGLMVVKDVGKRIRWTVTAEDYVLHDEWSPYRRLTVVPYFPHFRYGRTIGLVEGLIDPQELLNKTLSQELHVVNTMANSGWKVRSGALTNMTIDELEQRGAQTGLLLEVNGDPDKDIVKIQPNQIPQGLDRLSFKAESYIKSVSGRGDNQLGLPRADQSGRLAEEANKSSDLTLRKALDNLERTDWLLAHNILDLVQNFYTDYRIMHVTTSDLTQEMEQVSINVPDLESGEVLNDLSLGEYTVVVTSTKARRTLEESQFQQALGLRDAGIAIPDRFLIENSNLLKKGEIVKAMDQAAQSPAAQLQEKVTELSSKLAVSQQRGEVSRLEADAALKRAKAAKEVAATVKEAQGEPGEQAEIESKERMHQQDMDHKRESHQLDIQMKREKHEMEMQEKQRDAAEKRRSMRIESAARAKAAAKAPAPGAGGAAASRPAGAVK